MNKVHAFTEQGERMRGAGNFIEAAEAYEAAAAAIVDLQRLSGDAFLTQHRSEYLALAQRCRQQAKNPPTVNTTSSPANHHQAPVNRPKPQAPAPPAPLVMPGPSTADPTSMGHLVQNIETPGVGDEVGLFDVFWSHFEKLVEKLPAIPGRHRAPTAPHAHAERTSAAAAPAPSVAHNLEESFFMVGPDMPNPADHDPVELLKEENRILKEQVRQLMANLDELKQVTAENDQLRHSIWNFQSEVTKTSKKIHEERMRMSMTASFMPHTRPAVPPSEDLSVLRRLANDLEKANMELTKKNTALQRRLDDLYEKAKQKKLEASQLQQSQPPTEAVSKTAHVPVSKTETPVKSAPVKAAATNTVPSVNNLVNASRLMQSALGGDDDDGDTSGSGSRPSLADTVGAKSGNPLFFSAMDESHMQ